MAVETVLIPEERKPILIGRKGRNKAYIEKMTETKIRVGDVVEIEGEAIGVLTASNIALAIGRGFPPNEATLLLDENYCIDVISLHETEKAEKRLMARVIGRNGEAKRIIEKETGAKLAIYGKTITIIGLVDELSKAREVVELLIKGKTHAYAFKRMRGEV